MNDLNINDSGFLSKAAALLNSKTFSDVEIQVVIDGTNPRSYSAHKLFLAMNSEAFAKMFYGVSESPRVVKIFDFKPKIVYMMLEFLYMNKVNFSDTKEARELYTISKKFGIRNLQELCVDHISRKEVNNDNVLYMYECAHRDKYLKCLDFCRQTVSSNTKFVFESPSFVKTTPAVLEDILKQDTLTVNSELDVIYAVIKWASHECKRLNLTDLCHLRSCMFPLLRHVRLLNLKYKEFCDIVEKYPIFSAHESSLITRKLVQPDKPVYLPPYICQIKRPRMYSTAAEELVVEDLNPSSAAPQSINAGRFPHFETSKLKPSPVSKVSPLVNVSAQKTFDFSLQEAEKLLSTAFKNDVKCSVSIDLLKRMIIIHGVELRISQSYKTGELIRVFLNVLNGAMNVPVSDTFTQELRDGTLTLLFHQPMKILEHNRAEIEVTIEDLKLNRCCILKDPVSKLKYGSDIVADIALTSNQMNDLGEPFFLISRLIYSFI